MRGLFAIFVWVFSATIICALHIFAMGFLYGILLGCAWSAFLVSKNSKYFLLSVPEVTGLYTVNLITGELKTYRTGMHFRFPWEQVKDKAYVNTRMVMVKVRETYPSKNGPVLIVDWEVHYKPAIKGLPRFISFAEKDINGKLIGIGGSHISDKIANQTDTKSVQNRTEIEDGLWDAFENHILIDPDEGDMKIEDFYGIDIKKVALSNIDWEPDYQKIRTSEMKAKKLKKIAENLKKGKDISDKDAQNAALIINGDVKKNIQEVEGKGGEALAALLMAMAQGGKGGSKK
ncbi:MAG: hypothetical protein K9M15_01045 [Candidatus Marinimicrobia bacterium]|nr:hypothetical protein [Candidatus Neomarinimicrobiota bacterium]